MTAVEWLVNELKCIKSECGNQTVKIEIKGKLLKQAKEMEKEQIVTAHYQGYRNDIGTTEVSEQYYKQTFKSE